MLISVWTSLTKAPLRFSSPPWIELALPDILELQSTIVRHLDPCDMAPSVACAYLTCFTTHLQHSSRFTTLPAQLVPLVLWLRAPEQNAWVEGIQKMLLKSFDAGYLQAGLMIAASGCHQLQKGQSPLCCCSVLADHADYTSGKDLTHSNWAREHAVTDFLSALLVYHVCMPSMRLMSLQGEGAFAAAAAEAAATAAAEEEAKAASAAAVAAGAVARSKEEHAGSSHSMEHGIADLVGTSAGERGPGDVQVRCTARKELSLGGWGHSGAAPTPAAGGALLAVEKVGESGGNAARAAEVGEGEGSGAEGGAAAGGGGGGIAAGADATAAGSGDTGTEAPAEGTGWTLTTAAAAAATGCGAGGGGAAEGLRRETTAAVAGVTGGKPAAAAQAWSASSAAGSSQQEAVGDFGKGLLWLATANHAESLGETLAEYHAEDPVGYENVHYVVLKVLVELLLLQTGVERGPSLDTDPQVACL